MAAPNLKNPSTITGKTVRYAVTTTLAAALSNASNSNRVFKINSIFCANIDGANTADITATHFDGTTDVALASTITVPADATQVLSSNQTYFYLEEGQSIRAQASANGDLVLIISYEDFAL